MKPDPKPLPSLVEVEQEVVAQARQWGSQRLQERLHWLRHGREKKVLREIAGLKPPAGEAGPIVECEEAYFAGQTRRMNYQEVAWRGWPVGSGVVESACRQKLLPLQASGAVLDAQGTSSPPGPRRSAPQSSLESTLEWN
jgi:hypothetical protein